MTNSQRLAELRKKREEENKISSSSGNKKTYKNSERLNKLKLERNIGFDTFEADLKSMGTTIQGIYNGWQSQDTMNKTKTEVESMYNRLTALQEYNKINGNMNTDSIKSLDEAVNEYKGVLDNWDELSYLYKGYKSAEDYTKQLGINEKAAQEEQEMKSVNLDDVQKEIDDLNTQLENHRKKIGSNSVKEFLVGFADDYSALSKEESPYDKIADLKKQISERTAYLNRAEWLQKGVKMSGVLDENSEYYDKDFAKYVKSGNEVNTEEIGDTDLKGGAGKTRPVRVDDKYKQFSKVLEAYRNSNGDTEFENPNSSVYNYMTPEEFERATYFIGKDIEEGADLKEGGKYLKEYLYTIEEDLNARAASKKAEKIKGKPMLEVLQGADIGINQFFEGATNLFNTTDEYIPYSTSQQLNSMIKEDMKRNGKGWDVAYDVTTTTANMVPSILASTVSNALIPGSGAVVGSVLMGSSAAGNSYQEKLNLGWSETDARQYSTIVGVSEAGLQYALGGVSKLGGKLTSNSIKAIANGIDNAAARFVLQYGANMASEGLEESLQEVLNPFFENIALGYAKNDFSDIEWGEVAYSGMLGALSAGLLESVSTVNDTFVANSEYKKVGATSRLNKGVSDILDMAELSKEETETYNLYSQYAKKGVNADNVSDLQLGRLHHTLEADNKNIISSKKTTGEQKTDALITLGKLSTIGTESEARKLSKELTKNGVAEDNSVTSSGEKIDISGIKLGEDTKVVTSDGREISLSEITPTQKDADLLAHAKTMSENDANLFIEQYDGQSEVSDYADSFNLVMEYAKHDFTQDTILENKGVLSNEQVNAIYGATVINQYKTKQNAIDKLNAKHGKSFTIQANIDDSVIDYDNTGADGKVAWNSLNSSQKKAITFMKGIAKGTGMNLKLIPNGLELGINGAFDIKENTIVLDIYAGMDKIGATDLSDSIIPTASHEMTHWMKEKSPELYRKVGEKIFGILADADGISEIDRIADEMARMKKAHPDSNISEEDARDEIIARACEDMLAMSEEGKKIFDSLNETEKKTFVDKIKDIIENLKNWVNDLLSHYKSNSYEAKELRKYQDRLSELSKMWDEMLRQSIQANQSLQKEGITGEELAKSVNKDAKYSKRNIEKGKKRYYNELNSLAMQWANSADVEQGDYNSIYDGKSRKWCLAVSDENSDGGYRILTVGNYKEVKELEQLYNAENEEFDRYAEAYKSIKRTSDSGLWESPNGEMFRRDSETSNRKEEGTKRNTSTTNDEYVRSDNRETSDNLKRSDRDTLGNTLSEEQQSYFAESKVRSENGNLKVMYHGTPNATFTKFKSGTYFTEHKWYADNFQSQGASSLGYKKTADNPDTYAVYLNIKKPFDTRNKKERDIFYNEYYQQWGTGTDLMESGLPDWLDGEDLQEFLEEKGYDYDGLILDEGAVGGYGDEVKSRGLSYVVFDSKQVKSVNNKKPTNDPDYRFSMRENVEETKNLIAVHNLWEEKLMKSLNLGGLPMPSIAIIKAQDGHSDFGDISLVFKKDTIDPNVSSRNKIYSGDAYTPTYPQIEYKVNADVIYNIRNKISSIVPYEIQKALGGLHIDPDNMKNNLNGHNGNVADIFKYNNALKYAYLLDTGTNIILPMTEKPLSEFGSRENGAIIKVAENIPKEHLLNVLNGDTVDDRYEFEPEIRKVVAEYMKEKYSNNPKFSDIDMVEALGHNKELPLNILEGYANEALNYLRDGIQQTVDYKAASELIKNTVNQQEYEVWVNDLFNGIIEKEGIRNNKDTFTPSGNRRSFEALHYEHNLENVIKAMKENGEKGIGGFGGGNIFGAATITYPSIEDVKDAESKLQDMSQEEYDSIRNGYRDRFYELASSLPKINDFRAIDDSSNMLIEAVLKYKTKSGIANFLRKESEGWANYSDYIVDDLISLVNDIRNMPTRYFEAKPQRAVGFNEVATAIIPDNSSEGLKTKLSDNGVRFVEYESGNETARLDALNSLEDVKFSDRETNFTETEQFKNWFGNSKVVDENNNPLVVYHGTDRYFNTFLNTADWGYHFGTEKAAEKRLDNMDAAERIVIKAYLSLQNPIYLTDTKDWLVPDVVKKLIQKKYLTENEVKNNYLDSSLWDLRKYLMKKGYDGVIYKNRYEDKGSISYTVFESTQIKSATDNIGTFDVNNPDIRFSDRDNISVYEAMGEIDRLKKENEKFKADVGRLNERIKLERQITHGNHFNENQLDAVAAHIRNIANSNYSKADLVNLLKGFYSYIATSKDLNWQDVYSQAYDIAGMVLEEVKPITETNEYYKSVLSDIRNSRISVNEQQIQEAKFRLGLGNKWRNAFFNRIKISNDAISLDRQWQEWSAEYPDLFDADISDADMLVELYDIYDSLKAGSEIVVEYDMEEQARWLAREIYNQYWNVSPIRTTAEKYDKQIKLLNYKHREAMSQLRTGYKDRLKTQHKVDREKATQLIKQIRERKDKEIAGIKQRSKERIDAYKDNAARKTKIQSITAKALTLNEWLVKNSKEKHIHESLKGPVANLLQAIDFSSKQLLGMRGGEFNGTPTQKDISLQKALSQVKDMMLEASVGKEELVDLYGHDLDEDIKLLVESVDSIMRNVGDNEFILNKMTLTDLNTLNNMLKTIKQAVTKMNQFHSVHHAQGISSLAKETIRYTEKLGNEKIYTEGGFKSGTKKMLKWTNSVPYYAFKRYGEAGKKVFEAFQDGWDKLSFNVKEVIDFTHNTYSSKEVKAWEKEIKSFDVLFPATDTEKSDPNYKSKSQKVQMTTAQVMYLYLLNKRTSAKAHLLGGGIVVSNIEAKKGQLISQPDGAILEQGEIDKIIKTLTPRQIEVADALSKFMNTVCSDWGNEVSMARFGYKAFGEPNYVPMQVDKDEISTADPAEKNNSLFKLLNMSFTKSLTEGANNRLVISSIFDVFAQHTSDMAKYNALALPVLDAFKWYNYKEIEYVGEEAKVRNTVKKSIKKAFGQDGQSYITTLLEDINGQNSMSRDKMSVRFFKNSKLASVGMNLRVVLLQPTSYFRASANIDNKYLIKALTIKPKIKHAEKYCGMALWKSLGYYDTNIQRGVAEQIKHAETPYDKMIEFSMKGAGEADRLTLGYLWNAAELETRKLRKDLKVGSEEFFLEVGKRLRDIIYSTQVVDSTLTRSEFMRSPDGRDKILSMFASEPTLAYNILQDACIQTSLDARELGSKKAAFKKNGKKIARAITAYTITNAVAAIVESGFDVLRDDDGEELDIAEFMKLYLSNFAADMSIVGKIPYLKDGLSILQGYSPSRSDIQWMQSAYYTLKGISKHLQGEGNPITTIKNSIKTFSYLSGLPFYNAYRDIMTTLDEFEVLTADELEEICKDLFGIE